MAEVEFSGYYKSIKLYFIGPWVIFFMQQKLYKFWSVKNARAKIYELWKEIDEDRGTDYAEF